MPTHEDVMEVDRLLGEYLRLDAEKSATVASYNEALKELWAKIEQAHEAANTAQEPLPFPPAGTAHVCATCEGHPRAAHYTAEGDVRPCVLCGCWDYKEAAP